MRLAWLVVLAGCYHADTPAGAPCVSDADCPGGQTCVAQHCSLAGGPIVDAEAVNDGPVSHDATPMDAAASLPSIQYKTTTTATVSSDAAQTTLTIQGPSCAGGMMLASIAMGASGASTLPMYAAPPGWTLVRRSDHSTTSSLAIYTHPAQGNDTPMFTWIFDQAIEGTGWISCYLNVDRVQPVDVETGGEIASAGPAYTAPSLTTTKSNEMIVGIIIAHTSQNSLTTWTTNLTKRVDVNNGGARSGMEGTRPIANPGDTGVITTTASEAQDYAIGELLVLRQAP